MRYGVTHRPEVRAVVFSRLACILVHVLDFFRLGHDAITNLDKYPTTLLFAAYACAASQPFDLSTRRTLFISRVCIARYLAHFSLLRPIFFAPPDLACVISLSSRCHLHITPLIRIAANSSARNTHHFQYFILHLYTLTGLTSPVSFSKRYGVRISPLTEK